MCRVVVGSVGIICVRGRRTPGLATYSPGLEHDARLYEKAFAATSLTTGTLTPDNSDEQTKAHTRFEVVKISPEWDRNGVATPATMSSLCGLDVILGLEELGSADMIQRLQALKHIRTGDGEGEEEGDGAVDVDRRAPIIIWVPNLEVTSDDRATTKNGKWRATLSALTSNFIDIIIAKMPNREDFMRCIRGVYEAYQAELRDEQVIHVPHTCYLEESASAAPSGKKKYHQPRAALACAAAAASSAAVPSSNSSAHPSPSLPAHFIDVSSRTTILHFAGSSPHKNTLENCRAGLEIVKRLNETDAAQGGSGHRFTFTVFICPWPSKRGDGPPRYAIGLEAYESIKAMAASNPNEFKLIAGGFMSYGARRDLLARTRLALCASRAEGFGHYILEAAASGCMVVTTNGPPMSSLLTEPGTFALAEPLKEEAQCYGFGYPVQASQIVKAAMSLNLLESSGYSSDTIARCVRNETNTKERFHRSMAQLKAHLCTLVHQSQARFEAAKRQPITPPAAYSTSPPQPSAPSANPAPPLMTIQTLFSSSLSSPLPPMPSTALSAASLESVLKKGVFHAAALHHNTAATIQATTANAGPIITPPPGFAAAQHGVRASTVAHPPIGFGAPASAAMPTSPPNPSIYNMLQPTPTPNPSYYTPFGAPSAHSPHRPSGGATASFDAFTSFFASAQLTGNAPPQSHTSMYGPTSSLPVPLHARGPIGPMSSLSSASGSVYGPIVPPPLPLPTSPTNTFHSGTSSLAALEAKMRAQHSLQTMQTSTSIQPPHQPSHTHPHQPSYYTATPVQQSTATTPIVDKASAQAVSATSAPYPPIKLEINGPSDWLPWPQ